VFRLVIFLELVIAAAVVAPVGIRAGQSNVHREGDSWVETSSGFEAFSGGAPDQIHIASVGNIMVRGTSANRLDYTITRRVRTSDEAAAREAFEEGGINVVRQGRNLRLVVGSPNGPVDLKINAPRGASHLVIVTQGGNVDVEDLDGGVAINSGGGVIHLNHIKGLSEVQSFGGKLLIGDLSGPLRVSLAAGDISGQHIGGAAELETAGNIDITKIGGAARVVTSGGRVHIGEAGGTVTVNTGGGAIDVGRAGGIISLTNVGGGPISIGAAPYGIECANGSGGIHALGIDGAVHLATMTGSLVAQLQSKLLRESSLTTGAGDITLLIPSNVGVTIQAQNAGAGRSGGIISDFPDIHVRLVGLTAIAQGTVNGGGPILHLTANGGLIWIKKK